MSGHYDETRRKQVAVLLALASGLSKHAAASKGGIGYRQFARWQAEDEAFGEAVESAISQARASAEERVVAASEKDWRAAAWWLDYLDGVRRKNTPSELIAAPAKPEERPDPTEDELAAILEHARLVHAVLIRTVGDERAVEVMAHRLEERHRTGI
jgi:hypothetical protein